MNEPTSTSVRLVADIGGTNARFALLNDKGIPVSPVTLRCDDFPDFGVAATTFLSEQGVTGLQSAAIAVATPVTGDQIKLTNNHWSFSTEQTRRSLGLESLHVINDFTALALSVPHLPDAELKRVGGGEAQAHHPIAVIGPGTGLGVSGLVWSGAHWVPLQGEGGHVSIGTRTPREHAVYERLSKQYRHVSAERFLSGPGLMNIVAALREVDGLEETEHSPSDITRLGVSAEDASCEEALNIFCQLLGSCAGNLVLTLGAEGGVYIGGGIVPRLGAFFEQSGFRENFEAKGRMRAYLEKVPSSVIDSPYPALTGAAQLLA